eukprot:COSAG02_NODE_1801_length_10895_cov_4.369767_6_plen_43_part_00
MQESDKNTIRQLQSLELDLKSQLETAQTTQLANQDIKKVTRR